MAWDAVRAVAEHDADVAAFVDAQRYVRCGRGRHLGVAVLVFAACQVAPALFLVAMWNKDRVGVLVAVVVTDALAAVYGTWFVQRPRAFARFHGRSQYPQPVNPDKWTPWLGGGG